MASNDSSIQTSFRRIQEAEGTKEIKIGDKGYVMVGSICRQCKVLTMSECGRYFRVLYHHCSKPIETVIARTALKTSWFRAKGMDKCV